MLDAVTKLLHSTFSIARQLENTDIGEAAAKQGIIIFGNVAEWVSALTVALMADAVDITDGALELVHKYRASLARLNLEFPQRNDCEWAEEKLRDAPLFLKLAIHHDKDETDCVTSVMMWHIRHVICTIIGVNASNSEAAIETARLYLKSLKGLLDSEYLNWSYDIMDSPSDVMGKISADISDGEMEVESLESVENCLGDLELLVGLGGVKQEVTSLVNLMKVRNLRSERGLKMPEMSLHMVFSGNPGTGKTTVARLLGRIYKALGVLRRGHLLEVDRSGLVAGYVGQTALKTNDALRRAHGGILFIDEAYTLLGQKENDFGQEAIDTILKYMEDNRGEIVVIVAGYSEQMSVFTRSNPGLQSRFNKFIDFSDFSVNELYAVFLRLVESNQYYYSEDVARIIYDGLEGIKAEEKAGFANARTVRNVFEAIIQQQANRIANQDQSDRNTLHLINEDDVRMTFMRYLGNA